MNIESILLLIIINALVISVYLKTWHKTLFLFPVLLAVLAEGPIIFLYFAIVAILFLFLNFFFNSSNHIGYYLFIALFFLSILFLVVGWSTSAYFFANISFIILLISIVKSIFLSILEDHI